MINHLQWLRRARYWHARLGLAAALLFMLLATTGVAINHTEVLHLDQRQVSASWLMHWYGLRDRTPRHGYRFPDGYALSRDGTLVMDGRMLGRNQAPLIGAAASGGLRFLATAKGLGVYRPDGQQVDQLDSAALPATPILALGVQGDAVLIHTPKGDYASIDSGLDWRPYAGTQARWSRSSVLPAAAHAPLRRIFAPHLPLDRVLLDLHSGRLFGRYGPYAMDLAAIILLGLSLSGTWLFWQGQRRP